MIALQTSETPPEDRRNLPKQAALVDTSVNNASTRAAWTLPRPGRTDLDHGAACGVTVDGLLVAKAAIESSLTAVQS